jgi:FMN phosphatase YigB (HAD superfamily)
MTMAKEIHAIFIDTGNTLRVVEKDVLFQNQVQQGIAKLLETDEKPVEIYKRLEERYQAYKQWTKESLVEVSEVELWSRWMLPEVGIEKITPLASRLTNLWIVRNGRRVPRPDAKQTILELDRRGYVLGIIANSISPTEIPEWLEKEGLTEAFKVVMLSSTFGRRKPDPYIFMESSRLAGVDAEKCAYVGDNPSRDIAGARQAGYGTNIILLESETLTKEPPRGTEKPDAIIRECKDLLTIFPPRS